MRLDYPQNPLCLFLVRLVSGLPRLEGWKGDSIAVHAPRKACSMQSHPNTGEVLLHHGRRRLESPSEESTMRRGLAFCILSFVLSVEWLHAQNNLVVGQLQTDPPAPFSASWNTAQSPNRSDALTAGARDAAGNQTTSAATTVTVNNASPSPGVQTIPSLQDERNTYTSWGWTWTPSVEPGAVTETIPNFSVQV